MAAFAVFDAYVQEYNELLSSARSLLDEYKSSKNSSAEKSVQSKIEQLDECVKQMGIEAKSHGSSERKLLQDRISEFAKTLSDLKSEFRRAQEVAGRSELIGEQSAADRSRVLDINDKLQRQNDKIAAMTRSVMETEEVGITITDELGRNREKILSATEKSKELNAQMDTAGGIATSMTARNARQCIIS